MNQARIAGRLLQQKNSPWSSVAAKATDSRTPNSMRPENAHSAWVYSGLFLFHRILRL